MKKKSTCGHLYSHKGFTLMEMLITVAIISILIAIAIPNFTAYLKKVKRQQVIANGRQAYMAARVLSIDKYDGTEPTKEEVVAVAGVQGEIVTMTFSQAGEVDATEDKPFRYKEDGITAKYANGKWTIEGDEGSGSGSGGDDSGSSGGTGSGGAGPVTLTDSKGNTYTIYPSAKWDDIKDTISTGGHITPGTVLGDETGGYVYYAWNNYLSDSNAANWTLEELAAAHSDRIFKLTESTKIWITDDMIMHSSGSKTWDSNNLPKIGDLYSSGGKIYVAGHNMNQWETNANGGAWILIPQ